MTAAYNTIPEIILKPRKEAPVNPAEKRSNMDAEIERVKKENSEKDAATREEGVAAEKPKKRVLLTDAERKAKKAEYMRNYWRTHGKKYSKRPKTRRATTKDRDGIDNFKRRLDAISEPEPRRKKRKGVRVAKPREYKMPRAKRIKNRLKQREYIKGRKEKLAAARTGSEEAANGTFPPYSFKYCPECGHEMPTVEINGRILPAAKAYCGDCGYKIPLNRG